MVRRNFRLKLGALATVTAAAVATQVWAVNLPAGGAVPTPGTTAAARPELAGVVIQDVLRPFHVVSGPITVKGVLQDRVVRSNRTGTLHFYYRIMLDPATNASIYGVRKAAFGPAVAPTDVDWRKDGLGTVNPGQAMRDGSGTWVSFNHTNNWQIWPGQSSRFVFIATRAKNYRRDGRTVLLWRRAGMAGRVVLPTFRPIY